ncbi:MAG: type II secretion system F family protein [Candidatus Omnitrophica bacterium]|nr:type II secretion system F family protein [Candidatus Omnitrophota bacterium]MCM8831823.1 type II secretion system F family protein [Candidatus Omnitrophota bacterium]
METYQYFVLDSKNKKIKGRIKASSIEEVINKLHSEKLHILNIYKIDKKLVIAKERIKTDELVVFSKQLASLITAGIPIVKSLSILAEQIENKKFKTIIAEIKKNIESGESLSSSFSKFPQIFSHFFVNMVNAGECSGNLDIILERLSNYLKSYNDLIKKVHSAMIYPLAILIVAISILTALFIFVIPGFQKMFEGLGAKLPLPTFILINLSDTIKKYFLWIIGIFIFIFLILHIYFQKLQQASNLKERLIKNIPIIGNIFHKIIVARFVKTFATLTKSGVPVLQSLDIAAKASGNKTLENKIKIARDEIAKGSKIIDSLKKTEFFSSMVIGMIGVGEEGGDLPNMLEKVSEIYETDIDNSIAALISLLEPALIIFLGIVIGTIVLCLFLPILQLPKLIAH